VKQWNNGKQAEYGDRKAFKVPKDADGGCQKVLNAASGLSEL
jgi:hypothetical protein